MQELWVQFGTGEKRPMIPLHVLHLTLEDKLSFGVSLILSDADLHQAKQYLVREWAGARSKPTATTFDQLKHDVHRLWYG